MYDNNWVQAHNQKSADRFQEYVTDHEIATTDGDAIREWVNRRQPVTFGVISGNQVIFDSDVTVSQGDDQDALMQYSRWYSIYTIQFADKEAKIYYEDFLEYKLINIANYVLLAVSLTLFIILYTLLIRKKIKYVTKLDEEIHILESGDLKYEVTVKGYDELAHLARSLNDMRTSLDQQIVAKEEAFQANRELITALSHDLRTPLTTQTGYLEILKEGHYATRQEHDRYVEKCLDTCRQIRKMSDRLFEYFMAFQGEEEPVDCVLEEYDAGELFLQFLNENAFLLKEEGYRFALQLSEVPVRIRANVDFLCRIFDNLFSNLKKYADKDKEISVTVFKDGEMMVLEMKNGVAERTVKVESTKIGLVNVKHMMRQQGGEAVTENNGRDFCIRLYFPVAAREV